jgi:hypothetical protein
MSKKYKEEDDAVETDVDMVMNQLKLQRSLGVPLTASVAGTTKSVASKIETNDVVANLGRSIFGGSAYSYDKVKTLSKEQTMKSRGYVAKVASFASGANGLKPKSANMEAELDEHNVETARIAFNFVTTPDKLRSEAGAGAYVEASFANNRLRLDHISPDVYKGLQSGFYHMLPTKITAEMMPSWQTNYDFEVPLKARPNESGARTERGLVSQPMWLTKLKMNQGVAQLLLIDRTANANDVMKIQNWAPYLGANLKNSITRIPHLGLGQLMESSPPYHYYVTELSAENSKVRANKPLESDEHGLIKMSLETAEKYFKIAEEKLPEDVPLLNLDAFSFRIMPKGETNANGEYRAGSFLDKTLLFPKNDAPVGWEKSLPLRFSGVMEIQFLSVGIDDEGKN